MFFRATPHRHAKTVGASHEDGACPQQLASIFPSARAMRKPLIEHEVLETTAMDAMPL